MRVDVVTVFPGMLRGFLEESMLKRAVRMGAVVFRTVDLRDFAQDARRTVDDRPYGGGPGMIMKPEPWFEAIETLRTPDARVILMTPSGKTFRQAEARRLAVMKHLIFVCGHYEGVDERVREALVTDELSIGDYVLTNGVLPAAVVVDAVVRLLPGVLGGGAAATQDESFTKPLLEYPQYTRPAVFRGMAVPALLQNGNHAEVDAWHMQQSIDRTARRRPDLLGKEEKESGNDCESD
ncbi:MAG: tRNA (guanosine(37)-N1)-methyltransferase TrmD [Kiritimatiellae bacterium]|nr:tRNA (guanosine(37)-N1)-methyltransferase TrmD [Kiritimatiellia bacterium]